MSVFPVQVVLVLDWLQTYVDRGCVAGTISGMFDAVSWCAAKAGFDSLRGDSLVQDFLQGCVRVCPPQRSGGKVCWTVSMLHRVFEKHEGSLTSGCTLRNLSMLFMGFYAMLRASELLALRRRDVTINRDVVLVRVVKSKTDQAGVGAVVRFGRAESRVCPVWLLEEHVKSLGSGADGEFLFRSHRLMKPVSYGNFVSIVKAFARDLGLDPGSYAPHSLRSGGATEAALQGWARHDIMRHGRWAAADSVERYIRVQPTMIPG